MTHDVIITERALEDLYDLHRWIREATDWTTADAYQARIEIRLAALSEYPERGTPQDDLVPGARSISFERRIIIFYLVKGAVVEILRIVSTAREHRILLG